MKSLTLISLILTIFLSYAQNNVLGDIGKNQFRPEIPDTYSFDINHDNITDFVVRYKGIQTSDIPSSRGRIIGSIKPMNGNQLLRRYSEGCLFLSHNDTIQRNDNGNSTWIGYEADVISIDRHYQTWDKKWSVKSQTISTYFLAFKLRSSKIEKIGWLYLEFDLTTGAVIVSDFKVSRLDEIIIKK